MADRLSPADVSFLSLEESATAMNVGTLLILQRPPGERFFEDLRALIDTRIGRIPRYRRRLAQVPGRLANPVWVDDVRFDLDYHLRRSGLPAAGTDAHLDALVARIMSRPLDRTRPLWEAYLIEGLSGARVALLTKSHSAMVDAVTTVELSQILLDTHPDSERTPPVSWQPQRTPTPVELIGSALMDSLRSPAAMVDTLRSSSTDLRHNVDRVGALLGGLRQASTPHAPLNSGLGQGRSYARLSMDLDALARVRDYYRAGGRLGRRQAVPSITVNDVVLAGIAGGLRDWLSSRGRPPQRQEMLRALVPMSVLGSDSKLTPGPAVEALFVDLPVGESSGPVRLRWIGYQTRSHRESGRAVPARAIAELGGFPPATIHSMGVRLAGELSRRFFNLVITNVPGPAAPVYAAGAELLAGFPVIPLAQGQGLAIGVTSYHGSLHFGFYADRDALPDLDVLVDCVQQSLEDLVHDQ